MSETQRSRDELYRELLARLPTQDVATTAANLADATISLQNCRALLNLAAALNKVLCSTMLNHACNALNVPQQIWTAGNSTSAVLAHIAPLAEAERVNLYMLDKHARNLTVRTRNSHCYITASLPSCCPSWCKPPVHAPLRRFQSTRAVSSALLREQCASLAEQFVIEPCCCTQGRLTNVADVNSEPLYNRAIGAFSHSLSQSSSQLRL